MIIFRTDLYNFCPRHRYEHGTYTRHNLYGRLCYLSNERWSAKATYRVRLALNLTVLCTRSSVFVRSPVWYEHFNGTIVMDIKNCVFNVSRYSCRCRGFTMKCRHVELPMNIIGTLSGPPPSEFITLRRSTWIELKKNQMPFIYAFRTNSEPIHFVSR